MIQIRQHLIFKRKLSGQTHTYRVLSERALGGFWRVTIIDIDGRQVQRGGHLLAEQVIRDGMGEMPWPTTNPNQQFTTSDGITRRVLDMSIGECLTEVIAHTDPLMIGAREIVSADTVRDAVKGE
jgi:hypothetical protein